jgi:hypothetical protein
LAEAFKENSALEKLNLKVNAIGDEGARALSDAMRSNRSVYVIELEYNEIGEYGALDMLAVMDFNHSVIFEISQGNDRISSLTKDRIFGRISANKEGYLVLQKNFKARI